MEVCRATCVMNRESTVTRMMKPRLRFISAFQGLLGRHQWLNKNQKQHLQKVPFANCAIWGFFFMFVLTNHSHTLGVTFFFAANFKVLCLPKDLRRSPWNPSLFNTSAAMILMKLLTKHGAILSTLVIQNANLLSDCSSCRLLISGDHFHLNPSFAAFLNASRNWSTWRIVDSPQA